MPRIVGLDEKDRKILIELDKNARQADSQIAKKVGLSKQVANYRIQRLVSEGFVENFYTIVNVGLLGLNIYYVFLQFENVNKMQEEKILDKLSSLSFTGWVVSGTGRWDAVVLVFAESTGIFDKRLSEITNLCSEHLHEFNFTTLIGAEHLGYKFLLDKKILSSFRQSERSKIAELDKTDRKILEAISQNARLPITEISEKTKLPVHVINYRIKNLLGRKVIEGFKPKMNIGKIGLSWYLLLIQFQSVNEEKKKRFLDFCKTHDKIYYVTNTAGYYNCMLDVHVKSAEEFKDVLLELKENFSDIIKLYESIIIFNEHKISYVPDEIAKN